jgi:hypothetical protein
VAASNCEPAAQFLVATGGGRPEAAKGDEQALKGNRWQQMPDLDDGDCHRRSRWPNFLWLTDMYYCSMLPPGNIIPDAPKAIVLDDVDHEIRACTHFAARSG